MTTPFFAILLKMRREQAGLSLSDLASASGVSRGYLHLLERGDNNPTIDVVQKLADGLGMSITDLFGRDDTLQATEWECNLIRLLRERQYADVLLRLSEYMTQHP